MPIHVECYAGYRGEQEPLAIRFGERRVAVCAVVDRWYSPSQRWFKVEAEGGDTYIVRHDEPSGEWELAAYTSEKSPGTDLRCPTISAEPAELSACSQHSSHSN